MILGYSSVISIETETKPASSSIPYVATPRDTVQDMLWIVNVGKGDVVYDLGSGDGRIVIAAVRDFGARRAVGIEIEPELIKQSRENAKKVGVKNKVEFIEGDLFESDFREASVVTLFLGHEANIKLRPRIFRTLKTGTRIVSHQFGMGEWNPDRELTIQTFHPGMYGTIEKPFDYTSRVPDYTGNERDPASGTDRIMMWLVPASVAGVWRGKVETAEGLQDFELVLHQRLSEVSGTLQIYGETNINENVFVDVLGDQVHYWCLSRNMDFNLRFEGRIRGNTMEGTISVVEEGQHREGVWKAQREKMDYTGTWEWSSATASRSVRIRIEEREGQLTATYLDGDKEIPVTDFYDFGGGFYFTVMLDMEGGIIRDDAGWLIGEAVADNGALKGTIEFYPPYNRPDKPGRDWSPRLIKP